MFASSRGLERNEKQTNRYIHTILCWIPETECWIPETVILSTFDLQWGTHLLTYYNTWSLFSVICPIFEVRKSLMTILMHAEAQWKLVSVGSLCVHRCTSRHEWSADSFWTPIRARWFPAGGKVDLQESISTIRRISARVNVEQKHLRKHRDDLIFDIHSSIPIWHLSCWIAVWQELSLKVRKWGLESLYSSLHRQCLWSGAEILSYVWICCQNAWQRSQTRVGHATGLWHDIIWLIDMETWFPSSRCSLSLYVMTYWDNQILNGQ